ncbi:MAG: ESS family glutamate:Na+ symporter [Rhodothermales bacterium]|jgi:ESS family glutamate:Na+ symporter
MNAWQLELTAFDLMRDGALLGGALLVATILRHRVRFFQRYLIPNALIAGFLGLIIGPEFLGVVPISLERMGAYVYHLLALTFICVGLKGGSGRRSYAAIHLGFMQVMCMTLQALVGLAILLALHFMVDPGTVPAAGLLLPLGFAMGPGVAFSIGESWSQFGFPEGASVGLTMAAVGFLVAYVVGVGLVHRHDRIGTQLPLSVRTGVLSDGERAIAGRLTLSPAAVEPLAFHLGMVALVYGLAYLATFGLANGLELLGRPQEVAVVWSFHFILANLIALSVRWILGATGATRVLDGGLLDRLTGVMADYLIAASIMAISLTIAWRYALPIILMAGSGGLVTFYALRFASRRLFKHYQFERFIGIFGQMTGTVTSGLALIRILDPEYRSPVAQDLVLSSAIALALGFPLLAAISIPFTVYEGRIEGYFVLAGLLAAYFVVFMTGWWLYARQSTEDTPV